MNNDFNQTAYPKSYTHSNKSRKKSKGNLFRFIFELLAVVIIILAGVYIWNLRSDNANLVKEVASDNANPQALVQKQTNQIVSAVRALLGNKLPTNEAPVIATVTDVNAVKKQAAFFNSAKLGDKVLFYTKNGIVILYRPSDNSIIADGPLTFNK